MKFQARLIVALLSGSLMAATVAVASMAGNPPCPAPGWYASGRKSNGAILINVIARDLDLTTGKLRTEPVAGATVTLSSGDRRLEGQSDARGQCHIPNLPAGSYTIRCTPPEEFAAIGPDEQTVEVVSGSELQVNCPVVSDGHISGRALDSSGSPLSGLKVDLTVARQEIPAYPHVLRTPCGPDGRFEFAHVPPGSYLLGIRLDGSSGPDFPYPRAYYPGVGEPSQATVIPLDRGQKLGGFEFVAPPRLAERNIAGRAVLPDGTPAAAALIALTVVQYPYDSPGGEVETDAQGHFSLKAFEGLKYRIGAAARNDSAPRRAREALIPANGDFYQSLTLYPTFASKNLLLNPDAGGGTQSWTAYGDVTLDVHDVGDPCFSVRHHGHFSQDISIPADALGSYAVLIGRATTTRKDLNRSITGLPYLYGYMMADPAQERGRIWAYLQGQQMLGRAAEPGQWVPVYGIFRVPPKTGVIRFFLMQAEQRGVAADDAAAIFDDLGLYLFATEQEARLFVMWYAEPFRQPR